MNADDIANQVGVSIFGPRVKESNAANLNYAYDELGQLIRDKQEKIENITWRVDGKISYISRNNGSGKSELSFTYDAMGNRVEKTVNNDAGTWTETEYYVRDAQGNVMAIYKKNVTSGQMNYILTEQHMYGSSRLGVDRRNVDVIAAGSPSDNASLSVKRGEKHYELSNHLGNVLATVSDKKIAVMNGANLSYYRADVVSYSDYYPFGAPMTERTAVVTPTDVRYGFNGKEVDSEGMGGGLSTYDYGFRIYNPYIAKFLSTDPLSKDYPWYTPYQFAGNKPIWAIDIDGLEEYKVTGNSVVITMKYAAFKSRPEGGNVPSDIDIKIESQKNWDLYNKENCLNYGLSFAYNNDGSVETVSVGETQYKIEFNVSVEIFENENDPKYQEYIKEESFSGVYLFGETEFEGEEIKSQPATDGYSVPAFTQSIASEKYRNKEIVSFKDGSSFTKVVEVHEDGHTIGLSHWGVNGFGTKVPVSEYKDLIHGKVECFGSDCYDTEGMMKSDGPGSQMMKLTQVLNSLQSMEGIKHE